MNLILNLLVIICFLLCIVHAQQQTYSAIVEDGDLLTKPSSNIMVTLVSSLDPVYGQLSARQYPNREAKIRGLKKSLKKTTSTYHKPILRDLQNFGVETESFWVSNQIFVKNATPKVINYLRGLPQVKSISEERIFTLEEPQQHPPQPVGSLTARPTETEWNVKKIKADQVWNITKGEGIRVAIIDSGVMWTHESLKSNFVGLENNGWLDATGNSSTPVDNVGHGTHCLATSVGSYGIGVSPSSSWMACRACDYNEDGFAICHQSNLLKCGEWTLCNNDDCSNSPHVVSNSWMVGRNNSFFEEVIRAWNNANIIGVFAAGNSGPRCRSAGSPADQKGIISVGATDIDDIVVSWSSRGPAPDGSVTPLIVAPGDQINSAYIGSDDDYQLMSGTSMAAPAVTGAIALLKSQDPDLSLERIMELLFSTTEQDLGRNGTVCGTNAAKYPNNLAGHGRIDVLAAFNKLKEKSQR